MNKACMIWTCTVNRSYLHLLLHLVHAKRLNTQVFWQFRSIRPWWSNVQFHNTLVKTFLDQTANFTSMCPLFQSPFKVGGLPLTLLQRNLTCPQISLPSDSLPLLSGHVALPLLQPLPFCLEGDIDTCIKTQVRATTCLLCSCKGSAYLCFCHLLAFWVWCISRRLPSLLCTEQRWTPGQEVPVCKRTMLLLDYNENRHY